MSAEPHTEMTAPTIFGDVVRRAVSSESLPSCCVANVLRIDTLTLFPVRPMSSEKSKSTLELEEYSNLKHY